MKIGILSPDKAFENFLRKTILEYKKRRCLDIELAPYPRLKDILFSEEYFDILFIDDNFEHRSAVETARIIRTRNTTVTLILMSSSPNKVYESFAVKAHRYLLKPVAQTAIFESLDAYRKDLFTYRVIIVKSEGTFRSISSEDIFSVSASGKCCILYTKRGEIHSSTSFQQVVSQLPEQFFYKVHRSYVVNMSYVQRVEQETIYLTNCTDVPLSRRRKIEFLLVYNDFVKGNAH